MDKKALLDDLQALSEGKKSRSDTARLEDFLDGIEAALAKGVKRPEILASLHKHGFSFNMNGFQSALWLHRKKRRANQTPTKTETRPIPQPIFAYPTQPKPDSIPSFASSPPKPEPNLPGEKSALEKKQEAYKAFKESIKDRPEREQRKLQEEWRHQNSRF